MLFCIIDYTAYSEDLEQTIKEKDEYCNKLKMVALKAKKELEITKKKLKAAEEESTNLTTKVQALSAQLQVLAL